MAPDKFDEIIFNVYVLKEICFHLKKTIGLIQVSDGSESGYIPARPPAGLILGLPECKFGTRYPVYYIPGPPGTRVKIPGSARFTRIY